MQFRADEQRKSIKRLRQQTRLVQYTFSTVVVAAACCCCCYWNALKNTSNKCYSSLANQIAWCANIFVCLTKSKSFLFTRILFAYFIQFFIFLFWFSCFLLLNLFSVCDSSRLCVILVHTLAFIGLVFYLSEPDTNLFVYVHVEGWRREVWAAYVGCQSVYTAGLKPPTVNAWKCLVFCFFFGHEVLMMRLHISFCRLVSSRAKVTCHMRIVVGGDFVWFFSVVVLHLSFFLIFRASAWSWRAKSCAKCVFAMDIWICN